MSARTDTLALAFRGSETTAPLEVNLRELAAAGAQSKVVDALADYYRALADYWAALGLVDRIGR